MKTGGYEAIRISAGDPPTGSSLSVNDSREEWRHPSSRKPEGLYTFSTDHEMKKPVPIRVDQSIGKTFFFPSAQQNKG